MAKTKTKKLTRREMVVLLGSGVLVATTGEPAEAQGLACRVVTPNKGSGSAKNMILSGDPCCKDSVAVFLKGMGMTTNFSNAAKANLRPLAEALRDSEKDLLEYSVMLWGLKKEERDAFMKEIQERFALREYKKS
jgi:hypothetical protein